MKHFLMIITLIILQGGIINIYQPVLILKPGDLHQNILSAEPDTTQANLLIIKPFHLEIVSPSSGVQFYRNGIVFLAFSKGSEKMSQKHLSFGSVKPFMALVADTLPGQYMPFLASSSNIFPTEATTFSEDFNTMYLSLIPEKDTKEKIFKAAYTQNGWVIDDSPLSFCDVEYLYTHPALSNNGDFLIFSSNLKGSFGGLDLFISRKKDEKWSVPENLGGQINTTGNELFASLDADNNLYFSSDNLPGQGGYDIFVSVYNGQGWGKPQNLSTVINSPNDEVAFTIDRNDEKSAFYTSREKSGKGKMQLYRVTLNPLNTSKSSTNLSNQFFALAGIPKQTEAEKPERSETAVLIVPDKTVPSAKTVNDELIYRVQYAATTKPVGSQKVTIAGKNYYSYEYLYKGGYRSTVGKFSTLAEASRFLSICRQSGYNQPFLVAFKNNERITDAEARALEAQLSKTATAGISKTSEPLSPSENSQPVGKEGSQSKKGDVVYRVQILSNTKPFGSYNITVSGQSYKTFEYLYKGGYRTTVGEFSTLQEATKFLNICRKSGYNQAFIVVFKDNVRTNDPALFK